MIRLANLFLIKLIDLLLQLYNCLISNAETMGALSFWNSYNDSSIDTYI
jgi:hypothetical protein